MIRLLKILRFRLLAIRLLVIRLGFFDRLMGCKTEQRTKNDAANRFVY